jgi:cation:H+ antiporter
MLHALWLVLGLLALLAGGEMLVRGGSGLARRLGVPTVVIGLTVVAFGTSTPELVVNLSAALRGQGSIGFGNVVGSNIANIGLLLSITAMYTPLVIHRTIVQREIPMLGLASLVALVLGLDKVTGGAADGFSRAEGITFLLLFGVFLYYTIGDAIRASTSSNDEAWADPATTSAPGGSLLATIGLIALGLALLIGGGELTVRGAVALAKSIGIADKIIGLTLVAVGTSLPELATTLLAARQGRTDLAVGNIVGSNIFNLLFIWGLSVTLSPAALPVGGGWDLAIMLIFALALLPMAVTQRRIGRVEAGVLLIAYASYIGWLAWS